METSVLWSHESTLLAEAVPAPQVREKLNELSFLLLSLPPALPAESR